MYRKLAAVVALFVFAAGLNAAEVKGKLVKIDGDKITISTGKKGEKVEKTYTIASGVKVLTGKKGAEKALEEGLKNEILTKTGKAAPNVTLTTEGEGKDEKVTTIKVAAAKKKATN